MNCEKCGKEDAHFTGSTCSWGPDPSDAENTAENLPEGFAWLCDDCLAEIEYNPYLDPRYDNGIISDWQ